MKIRTRLDKCNISRYAYTSGRGVIAAVTLVLKTITKKNTFNRLSTQFGPLKRKKNKTCASKYSKMIITRRRAMQDLSRALTVKTR